MKRARVKIFCMDNTNELENVINEFLQYEYNLHNPNLQSTYFELVDIKMTEGEHNITATIIYTIGC